MCGLRFNAIGPWKGIMNGAGGRRSGGVNKPLLGYSRGSGMFRDVVIESIQPHPKFGVNDLQN